MVRARNRCLVRLPVALDWMHSKRPTIVGWLVIHFLTSRARQTITDRFLDPLKG